MRAFLALLVAGWMISTALRAAETLPPATSASQSQPADLELRVRLYERIGPLEELKKLSPKDLKAPENRQAQTRSRRRTGNRPQPDATRDLAAFDTHVALGAAIRLVTETRVTGYERHTVQDHPSVFVPIFRNVGATAEINASSLKAGKLTVQLKLTVTPAPLPQSEPQTTVYNKTFQIEARKEATVLLDDSPVADSDRGTGRVRFLVATLEPPRSRRWFARSRAASRPALTDDSSRTQAQVDFIHLTAPEDRLSSIDLQALTTDSPSVAEIISRLAPAGAAFVSFSGTYEFDSAVGSDITAAQQIPSTVDVNISSSGAVTPAITYQSVGSLLHMGSLEWKGSGQDSHASAPVTLENSGVAPSSTGVANGVLLPIYSQWKIEHAQQFRSGRPEYFTFRGAASPASPHNNANLYMARVVLTRVAP